MAATIWTTRGGLDDAIVITALKENQSADSTTKTLVASAYSNGLKPKHRFTEDEILKKARQLVRLAKQAGLSIKMPPKPRKPRKPSANEVRVAALISAGFRTMTKKEQEDYDNECALIKKRMLAGKKKAAAKKGS